MNYKNDKIKVRRFWTSNPMTRIKDSDKRYDRKSDKKIWKSNLDLYCN